WDGSTEIFSRDELIEKFTLDGLSKSNANFDEDKYLFMNGYYLRNMPREEVVARVKPWLEKAGLVPPEGRDDAWLSFIIGLEIERCRLLSEFPQKLEYFFRAPEKYEAKGAKKAFADASVAGQLRETADVIEACEKFE